MPDPALPQPWPSLAGAVRYRRAYRDPLGRPMTGTVAITGSQRTEADGAVTLPVTVTVPVPAGLIDIQLAPDTYRLQADLRTVDRQRVTETDTITLEES